MGLWLSEERVFQTEGGANRAPEGGTWLVGKTKVVTFPWLPKHPGQLRDLAPGPKSEQVVTELGPGLWLPESAPPRDPRSQLLLSHFPRPSPMPLRLCLPVTSDLPPPASAAWLQQSSTLAAHKQNSGNFRGWENRIGTHFPTAGLTLYPTSSCFWVRKLHLPIALPGLMAPQERHGQCCPHLPSTVPSPGWKGTVSDSFQDLAPIPSLGGVGRGVPASFFLHACSAEKQVHCVSLKSPGSCSVLTAWGLWGFITPLVSELCWLSAGNIFLGSVDKIKGHSVNFVFASTKPQIRNSPLHQEEHHHLPWVPWNKASWKPSQPWLSGSFMCLLCYLSICAFS